MSNVTNVDFKSKRVRHFQEEPKISRDQVAEAIDMLYNFTKEDYDKKIKDYSAVEQVVLHEIEDGDVAFLAEHAEEIILNLKDIRNSRREAKECKELKEKIRQDFKQGCINNCYDKLVRNPKQNFGSSKEYCENKAKRCTTSKEFLEKGLFENMILPRKVDEEEA